MTRAIIGLTRAGFHTETHTRTGELGKASGEGRIGTGWRRAGDNPLECGEHRAPSRGSCACSIYCEYKETPPTDPQE